MKPSWDDAPEWAQWLAMDEDGTWHWYENKPLLVGCMFFVTNGRSENAGEVVEFDDSLEQRPC